MRFFRQEKQKSVKFSIISILPAPTAFDTGFFIWHLSRYSQISMSADADTERLKFNKS